MKEFRDRIAVVTGAASGIGHAMAQRFAAEGMKVVLADVEEEALGSATRQLEEKGATVLGVPCDVSSDAQVDALAEKAFSGFGAVHILCNNAGVAGDGAPLWEQTLQNWQWVLGVNLWGVIHGLRSFVPRMVEGGDEGHIVNTASMAGHISLPMLSPYHATKFAVVTMTESLLYELQLGGAKLRASVLCPGFVRTRIMESERNRPAELRTEAQPTSEAVQAVSAAFSAMVEEGIPPAEVADCVLEAVRADRFYVFPHPEMLPTIRTRMQRILGQENPILEVPPDMQGHLKV